MSDIMENAFQIARYLDDHKHVARNQARKGDVRNALNLSPEDFHDASVFLSAQGYCKSTIGGDSEKIWILSKGIIYVDQMKKERISLSRDAEQLLKLLFADQSDFPFSLGDHIISEFNWTEDQYVQVVQELSDKGFVRGDYASGNPFFKIFILPEGRETIRNNFRSANSSQSSVQIEKFVANINDNKGIVNIGSTLTSVYQSLEVNSYINSSSKQEIEKLLQELESALKEVPDENADDAEVVAEMAKSLIENATKEKPNKKLIEISAEGLKKAAKDLAIIIPSVLLISEKLISFILALHR